VTHSYEVLDSKQRYTGRVIELRTDTVRMPDGGTGERDVVRHPGAVGAVAVNDDNEVLLIKQYRHALGRAIWEVPAGLRDVDGEPPEETAKRELHEETGWAAASWRHLLTVHPTPGWSDECFEVYLARDVRETAERPDVADEEQDLEIRWLHMDAAVEWVLDGRITNAMCVAGVLAAARVLDL
jgi:8-oxo-dGDP phosphatase